jgi:UDP-N-acetylglucosamine 2-epimerase (non-hydrolysing)
VSQRTIITVASARPNFVKVAPFVRAMRVWPEARHVLIHTGQHYDREMSGDFFDALKIPIPDINLGVGSGTHAEQTAGIMIAFERVCQETQPDFVVVVGDVNGTVAASLVAAKLNIPVAHIEAGLRSFDSTMPEEINRVVTDRLAALHFTPSFDADENLISEGAPPDGIHMVGNIMIDTLARELSKAAECRMAERLGVDGRPYVFVTLHRPSNVDDPGSLGQIVDAIGELSRSMKVIFPLHPRTAGRLAETGLKDRLSGFRDVQLLGPVGYHDCVSLINDAGAVITDSGGIQEETTYLGSPCLTLRPNTERPITITHGTNRLTTVDRLVADVSGSIRQEKKKLSVPPLWDGATAPRIVSVLQDYFQ